MFTFLVFLITLSVLVLVHELGHFLAAKKAGIKVEEFGFGYPPRLWGRKIGETIYSINWVPFGGFVRLYGEELAHFAKAPRAKQAFWSKSKRVRTAVIVAGVLGNFLLAIICFSAVYSVSGIPTQTDKIKIVDIIESSPADKIELKKEDIILAVDDQTLENLKHFVDLIGEKKGQQVKLLIKRGEDNLPLSITPRLESPQGEGPLGVVVSSIEMKKYPFWQMPFRGAIEGVKEALGWGTLIFTALAKMLVDLVGRGVVPKDVAGPIGILQITSTVANQGLLAIFQFVGILSVNLAVLNILPFPALDGGRLLFILYEAITQRRPKPSIEHWVNATGMAILLFLIILVTANDIARIVNTTAILTRFHSLWPF